LPISAIGPIIVPAETQLKVQGIPLRDWLFNIRKTEFSSLQVQIREALVSAILDGQLARDEPIPSTRLMAKRLGVSRNTVVIAYQGLIDDGYLFAKERSGYYVSEKALDSSPQAKLPLPQPKLAALKHISSRSPSWEKRLAINPAGQENISKPSDWMSYNYPFIYGQVDSKLFPAAEWRECVRQVLGKRWLGTFDDTWVQDDPMLVEQIRRRILPRRGIMASDAQVLITLGAQNALYLLVNLLVRRGTAAVIEEPGFPDLRNLIALMSDRIQLAPVDESGLVLASLPQACDLAFVTPSHQFPTTATMPFDRRLELLRLASERDFIIVEDDYEFEMNYVNEPCPALKSLDHEGRVIYVGSLSKSVFPGLRLGFLVAPEKLVEQARALRRLVLRHPPTNNQRTAARFLSLGHYDMLIRRLHKAYRARWEIMGAALQRHLPKSTRIPSFGGTSYWVRGPAWLDSEVLSKACAERGILIEPGRIYFGSSNPPRNYFRVGFSSIEEKKIEPGIVMLSEIMSGCKATAVAG
jgi:GntR family transcriptional regulator/MocR family aminotransferase